MILTIVDNDLVTQEGQISMKEVTGRDNQIICQALQIAIAIMEKHSLSPSNTQDMKDILDQRTGGAHIELPDSKVRDFLLNQI